MSWIKQLMEDAHGIADDGRVSAFLTVLGFIACAVYSVAAKGHPFDPQAYGIGAGALFADIGALFGLRKDN